MAIHRRQIFVIGLVVIIFWLYFLFDLNHYLNLGTLLQALQSLKSSLDSQPAIFVALFFILYLLVTASSLPVATALTLTGGILLGSVLAPLTIIPAATIGCLIPYFAARLLFRDYVQHRYRKTLIKINDAISDSGWWFLLSARLNPILPFVVLNLVSGVANISFKQYTSATFLGIIPGVVVVTYAGSQIDASIEAGTVLRPEVFVALFLVAIVPLVIRYVQKKLQLRKETTHD